MRLTEYCNIISYLIRRKREKKPETGKKKSVFILQRDSQAMFCPHSLKANVHPSHTLNPRQSTLMKHQEKTQKPQLCQPRCLSLPPPPFALPFSTRGKLNSKGIFLHPTPTPGESREDPALLSGGKKGSRFLSQQEVWGRPAVRETGETGQR